MLIIMDSLVGIINKLQDAFSVVGMESLQLPQIIVVGDQSSGKSSVLESVVGKSFLPRGTGVVTRRPIILQLVQISKTDIPSGDEPPESWGKFLHQKDKRYTDFEEIRKEIEMETERVAGCNKGICAEPIVLKIYSERNLNLTMVDLPGITKVAVGDQPSNIEDTIRELIITYIRNPNSIILAIVTANTDMATSESLKLAKEVDPLGKRTIAVVTKLDLMDAGTDAMDILCGKVIPVKLGIVGVVNRSQKDIQDGKSIRQATIDEATFLHTNYPLIASRHGSTYLAKTLQSLLMNHIQNCLPELKSRVNASIAHYEEILHSYGKKVDNPNETLLYILTRFASTYCSSIQGTLKDLETRELGGGARISYIFHETYGRAIEGLDALAGFNRVGIMTAIRNASGARPALFVPEICFELLVKKQIKKLEAPSLRCVELVYEEMERIIRNCGCDCSVELQRFPKLHSRIVEVIQRLLKARLPATNDVVSKMIQIHSAYINTAHPDFVRESVKISPLGLEDCFKPGKSDSQGKSIVPRNCQNEGCREVPYHCLVIEKLIGVYFNIVKRTVQDCVPKTIMHFLVNYVMENLLSELVSRLYNMEDIRDLLQESPVVDRKRNEATAMLCALEKANTIISEIKDCRASIET